MSSKGFEWRGDAHSGALQSTTLPSAGRALQEYFRSGQPHTDADGSDVRYARSQPEAVKTTDFVCVSVMGLGEGGERERGPKCTESDVVELDDRAWWTLISFREVLQTA